MPSWTPVKHVELWSISFDMDTEHIKSGVFQHGQLPNGNIMCHFRGFSQSRKTVVCVSQGDIYIYVYICDSTRFICYCASKACLAGRALFFLPDNYYTVEICGQTILDLHLNVFFFRCISGFFFFNLEEDFLCLFDRLRAMKINKRGEEAHEASRCACVGKSSCGQMHVRAFGFE